MSAGDHEEIGRRILDFVFEFCAIRPQQRRSFVRSASSPQLELWPHLPSAAAATTRYRPNVGPWALGQRRLQTLAVALQRPEVSHVCGSDIAREFGVTKQAVNLDAQRIEKRFGIAMPTAHRG